jgi:hypothetical protein
MESKGVRHFEISNGQLPATAVVIDDFSTDHDVLVIGNPKLSRNDLRFLQNGNDTIVQVARSAKGAGSPQKCKCARS